MLPKLAEYTQLVSIKLIFIVSLVPILTDAIKDSGVIGFPSSMIHEEGILIIASPSTFLSMVHGIVIFDG